MPVSREEVIHGFRLIMGREPGSEEGIAHHMKLKDVEELAAVLLKSAEFQSSPRFKDFIQVRPPEAAVRVLTRPHVRRAGFHALVIGNCQVATVASLMQAMTGDVTAKSLESTPEFMRRAQSGELDLTAPLAEADFVYVQMMDDLKAVIETRYADYAHKIRNFPPLNFAGFHPDCVYIKKPDGTHLQGPMGDYHSSIAFWGWSNGWSVDETLSLFDADAYRVLEFETHAVVGRKVLQGFGRQTHLPLDALVYEWDRKGVWMHTINHPRISALADLTAELLRREGIEPITEAAAFVDDRLARFPVWPVYPPLAVKLGVEGSYLFKIDRGSGTGSHPHIFLSLEDYVSQSFKVYKDYTPEQLRCDRLRSGPYGRLAELRRVRPPSASSGGWLNRIFGVTPEPVAPTAGAAEPPSGSPYADLDDRRFWRRAMEKVAPAEVDPVAGSNRFRIDRGDQVATAGSCFAQHIARTLSRNGMQYLVTEAGADLPQAERDQRQFGLFSARYGNIYTARQLVQLFERAYGRFRPLDAAWRRTDGRWVDPFRPQVEPAGYASEAEVLAATEEHLTAVRRLFEQMDVFVFTLGLTEGWQRREDGGIFPLAPGVVAGNFDPARYAFVNFTVAEVVNDIRTAIVRLRSVNSRVKFIFTVSPVPLIATYEDRHVLVSTTESKAILRAAIGEVTAADPSVAYFPSYEIITGQHVGNRYFAPDLRSVTEEGVAHVMRLFMQHYAGHGVTVPAPGNSTPAALEAYEAEHREMANVVCDEEAIERHRAN